MPVVVSLSLVMPSRPTSVNIDEWNAKKLEWYQIYVRAPYKYRRSTRKKSDLSKNEWMIRTHSMSAKEILHNECCAFNSKHYSDNIFSCSVEQL
uniref:Uncharacterized protein n=1 Tax=Parascaris equorum TaxID=6256 RepID=A0A914RUD2_PAREQ